MVEENLPPEQESDVPPAGIPEDNQVEAESAAPHANAPAQMENAEQEGSEPSPTPEEAEMIVQPGDGETAPTVEEMEMLAQMEAGAAENNDASEEEAEAAMLSELSKMDTPDSSSEPEGAKVISNLTPTNSEDMPTVSPVELGELDRQSGTGESRNIDILMDVKLPVQIELGRTEMTIKDILELSTGSVVELERLAGEPVDLLVNSRIVAKGEVVVVDENFGIRVTNLLSAEERLKSL